MYDFKRLFLSPCHINYLFDLVSYSSVGRSLYQDEGALKNFNESGRLKINHFNFFKKKKVFFKSVRQQPLQGKKLIIIKSNLPDLQYDPDGHGRQSSARSNPNAVSLVNVPFGQITGISVRVGQ